MSTSLPKGLLGARAPSKGTVHDPVVETDGECLYIRRVKIGEKEYDIRIWRYDAAGDIKKIGDNISFFKELIQDVAALATEAFKNIEDPTGHRLWFSDVEDAGPWCKEENLSEEKNDAAKFDYIDQQHPTYNAMREIHHLFFHQQKTILADRDHSAELLVQPNKVSAEPFPPKKKKVLKDDSSTTKPDPEKKPKAEKKADLSTAVAKHLPKAMQQSTSGKTTEIPKQAAEHVEALQEALAAGSMYAGEGFLKGVAYSALSDYASKRKQTEIDSNSPLEKAYQAHLKLLRAPLSTDEDAKEMKKWLKHHYQIVLKKYKNDFNSTWEKSPDGRSFESWCEYYAAKAIIGFIFVDNQNIESLVAELQKPDPATAKNSSCIIS